MSLIIASAEIRNFKRIKVVNFDPKPAGLTTLGGKNRQGKTSAINAIQMGLSGGTYKPSEIHNDSGGPGDYANVDITTTNGFKVRIHGKNGTIEVTDPEGKKGGITLFGDAISSFAVDLRKFINENATGKHNILAKALGLGDLLAQVEQEVKDAYTARTQANGVARNAEAGLKSCEKLPEGTKIPKAVDVVQLSQDIQDMGDRNQEREDLAADQDEVVQARAKLLEDIEQLKAEIEAKQLAVSQRDTEIAAFKEITPKEDPAPLNEQMRTANATNENRTQLLKVQETHQSFIKAEQDAKKAQADAQAEYEAALQKRTNAIAIGDMPDGITLEDGKMLYHEKEWDLVSGAEELIIAMQVGIKTQDGTGFVLADGLEAMDSAELAKLDAWGTENKVQIIGTVVTEDPSKCSIFIHDGTSVPQD